MTPQSRPIPVILTRPATQGARFAALLSARFGDAVTLVPSPLIAPVFPPVTLPDTEFAAVILTSETGALAAGGLPLRLRASRRAYCVGDRTAQAAREQGFDAVSAAGNADALVTAILAAGESGPLLHLRGRDSRGEIAARLTQNGCPTQAVIVYAQEPQPLTPEARRLLSGSAPVAVPLFSPRSAQLFAATRPTAPLLVAALSPAVAENLGQLAPLRLTVAARPDAAAMIDAIVPLIQSTAA